MAKLASRLVLAAVGVCVFALGSPAEATILSAPQGLRAATAAVDVTDQVQYRRHRGYVHVGRRYHRGAYWRPRYRYARAYYRRYYAGPPYYYSPAYYGWSPYYYRRAYYGWPYYRRAYFGPGFYVGGPGFAFAFGGGPFWW
jgi:hypothetical protein